jgi:ribonuclease P protein component
MFSKQHRLAKDKDIKGIFALGRSVFNLFFTVKYAPNKLEIARFTIVVSTKVFKKATKRNRLKRILREFIKLHLSKFRAEDYIIILKPKAVQTQEQALLQSFYQLLLESKLLQQ